MTSPTPANGGDTHFSSNFLSHDGFPSILWEVLNSVGYPTPPSYTVQLYEEHRVSRCQVWLTLEAHLGLTMGRKFCTIRFKDQVGLGSGFISSHF
jgi:hypothetical protein